jgi:CheY-like chemotaxis protein
MIGTSGPGSLRVLIIDDCVDTADSLAILTRAWGYPTELAYTAEAGWRLAAEALPDVILLDADLPDWSGWELAPRLRALPGLERALLVMVSGYGRDEDQQRSLASGCDLHLTKPVDPGEIQALLEARRRDGPGRLPPPHTGLLTSLDRAAELVQVIDGRDSGHPSHQRE